MCLSPLKTSTKSLPWTVTVKLLIVFDLLVSADRPKDKNINDSRANRFIKCQIYSEQSKEIRRGTFDVRMLAIQSNLTLMFLGEQQTQLYL
mgnify:CR=1 FL=1